MPNINKTLDFNNQTSHNAFITLSWSLCDKANQASHSWGEGTVSSSLAPHLPAHLSWLGARSRAGPETSQYKLLWKVVFGPSYPSPPFSGIPLLQQPSSAKVQFAINPLQRGTRTVSPTHWRKRQASELEKYQGMISMKKIKQLWEYQRECW